jgi:putative colanic acid biosynthesis UDP-glucose lipid carrier transferase
MKRGLVPDREGDLLGVLQRLCDSFWVVVAHLLASRLYGVWWSHEMTNATGLAVFLFGLAAEIGGIYRPWRSEALLSELGSALVTWFAVPVTLVLLAFATKTSAHYSRVGSFGWFLIAPLLLCSWRLVARLTLRQFRAHGRNLKRVAVVGATAASDALCQRILERPWMGMKIVGVYDDRGPERRHPFTTSWPPNGGGMADLIQDCRRGAIDIVYIGLPLRAEVRIGEIVHTLADTTATVHLLADLFTFDLLHARWAQLGNIPFVSIYDTPFRGVSGALKRLEDIVLGALLLALISVPMALIAMLVKLTSKGPVFFRQRRYGLNGREIRVLKFRTMTVCEDGACIRQAVKGDARITPLGAFLRRTSLDELPQFIQVLTGEMSIVGPRPHAVAHNEEYRSLIHGYMLRHKVKPGITGWAQINGWRGETGNVEKMAQRVKHDLEYIKNWSLLWDMKIILLTAFGRKKNQNAY